MTTRDINTAIRQEFGQVVAEFALPLLNGSSMRTLHDFMKDKQGVVVVFWSAVCTHCRRYDNYFNSFSELHPDLGLVAIASRYGETAEEIRDAVRQRRLLFPILLDEGGETARRWH